MSLANRISRFAVPPRVGIVLAVAALAVTACGNGSQTASPASASASPSVESSAAGSPAATTLPPAASSTVAASPSAPPSGASPSPPAASPSAALPYPMPPVTVTLARVVGGLPQPVAVANAGDDRLFVVGQTGQIVIVANGKVAGTFLDVSDRISCCGERGLLGLAFHPQFASNGRFFVRYTDRTGDVRISEFRRSGSDPNRADASSERPLLTVPHRTYANHNAGTVAFGPDGYLYVATGDGGGAGDPFGNGQKLSALLGKMLRIDVDAAPRGGRAYAIPEDNPFVGRSGALPEIWAVGLRNPYGFSFDRETGDLWIADVGQNAWEEIDRVTKKDGLGRGANFGWSVMEGRHCYRPSSGCDTSGKTLPIAEYDHGTDTGNGCAVIGGSVYRGTKRADLVGRYFFADYCSGRVWDLNAAGPSSQDPQLVASIGAGITSWGESADGELYATAADGGLYELR